MILDNKNIIITGGAGGIGSSTTKALLKAGANVAVIDKNKKGLELLKKSLKISERNRAFFYNININNFIKVKKTINNFFLKKKTIHGLINNAAVLIDKPLVGFNKGKFSKYSLNDWNETLSSNLNGYFYVTREVVEKMVKSFTKGILINVSSISSSGNKGQTAYSASKSAINALTTTWSQELGSLGIRVAGIAPGIISTQMPKKSLNKVLIKSMINKTPVKRMGTPEEVAHGIIFIIENDFFCGRTLELDGGLRM